MSPPASQEGDRGSSALRTLKHSGPRNADRFNMVPSAVRQVRTALPPGKSVEAAVVDLMQREGCIGGVVELSGGWLDPFSFVVPADDPRGEHAVWYSDTFACAGGVKIERASISVGRHNGAPFMHCHGLWRTEAGNLLGGHMLLKENLIVEPVSIVAALSAEGYFDRRYDPETKFDLFTAAGGNEAGNGLLLTVRANEDIFETIETAAERAGITSARVRGVGSLIDMHLTDGTIARSPALEVFVTGGRVISREGRATLEGFAAAGVGMDGVPFAGELQRGTNLVCVTFEIILEPD